MKRFLRGVVFGALLSLVVATPAYAGAYLDEAVAALKNSPAFVAAGTEGTDANTAVELTAQLSEGDNIVVAMLPTSAAPEFNNDATTLAKQLDQATGHKYIVAVSLGETVATETRLLPPGVAADLMGRAESVSTSTRETLITYIRNVHTWQAAHPEEVAKRQPPESKKDSDSSGFLWIVVTFMAIIVVAGITLTVNEVHGRRRRAEPKIRLQSPNRLHDELRDILDRRSKINDATLNGTITQMVHDTEELFGRLRANTRTAATVDQTTADFESHLQNLLAVLDRYIDIQNKPRYYENPQGALADGREAINGFAEYVLNSARRAGNQDLTTFRVNTKILSAQRYA